MCLKRITNTFEEGNDLELLGYQVVGMEDDGDLVGFYTEVGKSKRTWLKAQDRVYDSHISKIPPDY